jgi:hypothetical protein
VPLIRLVQSWLFRIGVDFSNPGWTAVTVGVGILLFPLVIVIAAAALIYEITIRVDRGNWFPSEIHWALAWVLVLVLLGVLLFVVL